MTVDTNGPDVGKPEYGILIPRVARVDNWAALSALIFVFRSCSSAIPWAEVSMVKPYCWSRAGEIALKSWKPAVG